MSPTEAAKLLDLPADASPEHFEARFHELRTKLEEKIGKAPTPGLKAKYRESLDEITSAFETLTLAADSSALPVLKRKKEEGGKEKGGSPVAGESVYSPSSLHHAPVSRRKSGYEFVIVAVIAVAVLGAGGWFVMKTRAETEAKIRIAAEAKAEAERQAAQQLAAAQAEKDRQAAAAREEAEARRVATEQEKARNAAETERVNKSIAMLRSQLAEAKILWSAIEQVARSEEQRASSLRSEERDLERQGRVSAAARTRAELAAQEALAQWLGDILLRHPTRIALVQAEELVAARSPEEAQAALERGKLQLQELEAQLAKKRRELFVLTTSVSVAADPAAASWELTDAYGEVHRGQGQREVAGLPFGRSSIRFSLADYPDKRFEFTVAREANKPLTATFVAPRVTVESIPAGAEVVINGRNQGVTPLTVTLPGPQKIAIDLRLSGYRPFRWENIQAKEADNLSYVLLMSNRASPMLGFGFTRAADNAMSISGVMDYSPAALAGLESGDRINSIHDGTRFVPTNELSNFAFLQLLAGKASEKVRIQINPRTGSGSREVSLERRPLGEIEDSASSFIHYLRGVVLMELRLSRRVEVAGRSWQIGEWNRVSVRVKPGRHRVWLEGVGEYFVDVAPGAEVYVRGTMHGFKTLSAEEGEALGRKLTHVNGSEYQRPPPILP